MRVSIRTGRYNFCDPKKISTSVHIDIPELGEPYNFSLPEEFADEVNNCSWDEIVEYAVEEYDRRISWSTDKARLPQLRKWLENGGTDELYEAWRVTRLSILQTRLEQTTKEIVKLSKKGAE